MADPYAAALGFGASAPVAPSDPYAAALGFTSAPKAKKAADVPDGVDVGGAPLLAQSPQTQAAVLADVRRTGAQNFTVNGAAPDDAASAPRVPVQAIPQPAQSPGQIPGSAAPNAPGPGSPTPSWWDRAKGVGQGIASVADTVLNVPSQVASGAVYAGSRAVGQSPEQAQSTANSATGWASNPVGKAFGVESSAGYQGEASKQLMNFVGENIGKGAAWIAKNTGLPEGDVQNMIGTLSMAAPAMVSGASKGVAGAVESKFPGSMQALQDQFAAKRAGQLPIEARVDPTMGKPRYGVVDGKIQRIDQPNVDMTVRIPGQEPVTSAPTLTEASPQLQKAAADAKAAGTLNTEALARHVEADTLPVPGKLTRGQALGDPALISDEMNAKGKGESAPVSPEFYREQGRVVAKNMDAIRASAAPDVPSTAAPVDHGQTLIDSYKKMDLPIQADITSKYKALADANGGELPLSGQAFVAAADNALKKANRARFVPPEVQGILSDLREGGPMTFNDFENYRTILSEQARKADRAGDGTASYAVGVVRNALESLPMEGEAANLKPLADAARGAAKARFDAIKSDPAYKAAIGDTVAVGEPSPLADKFFNAYVTKGARANVGLMKKHLADDSIANQTISAGTMDQLASLMKADPQTGNFRSAAYLKGLDELGPKLNLLLDPKTAQQAQAVGNFAKNAQAQPRGSYVNNSNTFTAMAGDKAATALEKAGNMVVPGLGAGTDIRNALARRAAAKAGNDAIKPGAGITGVKDFPR